MCCRLRRFSDVRYGSLTIGGLQLLWALVPLLDFEGVSLFAQVIGSTKAPMLWAAVSITMGSMLVISSIWKWRDMLLLGLALNVLIWLAGFSAFVNQDAVTPVSVSMPFLSLMSLLLLAREVVVGVRFKAGARSQNKSFSDWLGQA